MSENGHDDVTAVLTRDHREVQALFDALDENWDSADPKQRREQTDRAAIEFARHTDTEERYLYPVVCVTVDGGEELADRESREHAQVEQSLRELAATPAGDSEFEPALRHLTELVRTHIAEQEQTVFPRLRSVCDAEDLADIGDLVSADKKAAPARPQPGLIGSGGEPDDPAAPEPGLVSRIRDAFGGHAHGHGS